MDYSVLALPKGKTRKQVKSSRDRHEATVKKQVRAACVTREAGYCRAYWFLSVGLCGGQLEWAHLGQWKRFRTRKMAPELRHSTAGSLMLCTRHHRMYDAGELVIEHGALGADGPLVMKRKA